MGGKINQATGYEDIERLRNGVADKGPSLFFISFATTTLMSRPSTEKALLLARSQALDLKKEYTARVKTRADSQREVNDLLQRKSTWNSADVLRYASSNLICLWTRR